MAKKHVTTMDLEFSPELVFKVISDPQFQKANILNQGNPDAKQRVLHQDDERLHYEAETTEYAKGIRGINKRKTETTYTTWEWNLVRQFCDWRYKSAHGDRVRIWGTIRVEPRGEGARVVEEFNCEVRVPLAGGRIEKVILNGVKEYMPRYERLLGEWCAREA